MKRCINSGIQRTQQYGPYDEDGALTIPTFTGSTAGKLYNDNEHWG